MASLDTQNSTARNTSGKAIAFRVTGDISDYRSGTTNPKTGSPQPYVSFRIDGTTTTGKPVRRTVMGFGSKAIAWLDVQPTTRRAGVFVKYDERGNNRAILIPMGPYRAD